MDSMVTQSIAKPLKYEAIEKILLAGSKQFRFDSLLKSIAALECPATGG